MRRLLVTGAMVLTGLAGSVGVGAANVTTAAAATASPATASRDCWHDWDCQRGDRCHHWDGRRWWMGWADHDRHCRYWDGRFWH